MSGKVKLKVEEGAVLFSVDSNEDGQDSIKIKLNLGEAVQEAFQREESIEGAKIVDFKFSFTKLQLKIDTDRDGENLLELELDLGEIFDEVKDQLTKKSS